MIVATMIEAAWEIAENSPIVIDRYRTATIALGYTGDSVINSLADIVCMIAGLIVAAKLRTRTTALIAIALELLMLIVIRDNLTLNVLMLAWPINAIRQWQAG